jgi:hypothetical protein
MHNSFKPLHNKSFTLKKNLLVTLHLITDGYLSIIITHWFHSSVSHARFHPKKKYPVLFRNGIIFSLDAVNYDTVSLLLPEAIVTTVFQLPSQEHEVYNGKDNKDSLI